MASESFMFERTPELQSLVDDFMTNTYPNWKTALETNAKNLGAINTGAAQDWGKQKSMIGSAQVPVNFTVGGNNLATWVPYRTSMGNAIDKEAAYKSAASSAALQPSQTLANFYSETVAPMEKQRMASLGQLGYVEMYDPATKNSGSFPTSMVPDLEARGWQLGSPDKVNAQSQYWDKALEMADPKLAGELTNMMSLIKMGVGTYKELEESGLIDWVKKTIGDDAAQQYFDSYDFALSDYTDYYPTELAEGDYWL